ncbi:hypothetical protein [Roseovarius autotrophicus]|uniref:hypothetical protein n=1 Tax=Roseovarius autotrophicus TaxID=2824121 RepID=UPI001A0D20FB|nr:hypothetical protein [Roseovarius autotrophicus]MBE0452344.1 hypothetical protein [Roseovarius sp.]
MSEQPEIPAAIHAAATQQNALPPGGLVLLGTMHGPDTARALLRLDNGKIRSVETGAQIGNATVAAIGEGVVILATRGRAHRLEMPRS